MLSRSDQKCREGRSDFMQRCCSRRTGLQQAFQGNIGVYKVSTMRARAAAAAR